MSVDTNLLLGIIICIAAANLLGLLAVVIIIYPKLEKQPKKGVVDDNTEKLYSYKALNEQLIKSTQVTIRDTIREMFGGVDEPKVAKVAKTTKTKKGGSNDKGPSNSVNSGGG